MDENPGYLSILHLTDPHILPEPDDTLLGIDTCYYLDKVIKSATESSHNFDFCLLTGDLAQHAQAKSYHRLLVSLKKLRIPCMCLPGNHDDFQVMQTILNDKNINCHRQRLIGNWHIIGLNSQLKGSAGGFLAQEELTFLEKILATETQKHVLLALHHHSVPTNSLWMDTMIIKNAAEFLNLIGRYPRVKAIINGHIHQTMDLMKDGLRILTTPSTCFQFKPYSTSFALDDLTSGYRWLKLYPDGTVETGVNYIAEKLIDLETNNQGY